MNRIPDDFQQRVVDLAISIPKGKVATYDDLARAAGGGVMDAEHVNRILAQAYQEGLHHIPFHRIVHADGSTRMSQDFHEQRVKAFSQEGIKLDENHKVKHLDDVLFKFE